MNIFDLHILGCGSALPTMKHYPSAQVVNVREKLFMIDCGEGAQLQFRKSRLRFGRLNHIFISHLHGDHCFGLIGLISTLGLLGRTGDLVIHAVAELETLLRPQLNYHCRDISFDVKIEAFDPSKSNIIYQDRSLTVKTIPLSHRIPCAGFLFQETENELHLKGDMVKFYNIPIKALPKIKKGDDYITDEGVSIPNERLTTPATPSRSYAYCSDTAYDESIVPIIRGVDLLYHEATFVEEDATRARQTGHSTAKQAAKIAKMANVKKLVIGHFSSRYTNDEKSLSEAKIIFANTILANENLHEKL